MKFSIFYAFTYVLFFTFILCSSLKSVILFHNHQNQYIMKKKQVRKFIALFECLPLAGEILSGETVRGQDTVSKITRALQSAREIRDDPHNRFMINLFDEIDHNLYHLPDSRLEPYVADILRGLTDISLFLCYPPGAPLPANLAVTAGDPQNDLPLPCLATLRQLTALQEDTDIDDESLSDVAKYVFSCYALLLFFSKTFDARCLHFKLDLYEIQERLGIYIPCNRDYNELINAGYWDKVLEEVSKDETPAKALPENSAPESTQVRPFTDWLHHKNPEKLASVCKQVFDTDHRPKDYAIMLCLLHQNDYIRLPEKHRTGFYDSWYAFIGKPFPKNHNYYSINKHIDTNDGFQVINDEEPYYLNIKTLFDRKLRM